jgi:glucose-6-phosphate isomerase
MNEGQLDKDKEVWYYKEKKDIIGPVSSYNMDKMVWFKTIQEDTKVAFQTVDKFVKFSKIKNIVDSEEK